MAIRVRCKNCRKKIQIDEAFAGGVCRCPYCGALNTVAGAPRAAAPTEPRPERPNTPAAPPPTEEAGDVQEAVPLARPVMIQGVVAIVLLGFLLLMLGISGALIYKAFIAPRGPDGEVANPMTQGGARVAGMEFETPVVYVLDAGSGTGPLFDLGAAVVRHSVRGLGTKDKFNVIVVSEEGMEKLAHGWTGGGEEGDRKLKAFLADRMTVGASKLDGAIEEAMKPPREGAPPGTVVVLSGKAPSGPGALAEKASAAGVSICAVSLGGYSDVDEAMQELANRTGGEVRSFSEAQLQYWLGEAPTLP